jgi:DNA repair protein RecO (recombination protein O)
MPLIETESIVLKTYNLAEADRIVVFLTSDHGLVRGVAKGAKRLKSKFGSSLEPFSVVRLEYFQKDSVELVSIQNVELYRSYFGISRDNHFLETFAYLGDLLTSITPPDDPNNDLFRMVNACLDASLGRSEDLRSIGAYFELWLLRLGGYLPDWTHCEQCARALASEESAELQPSFQLVCARCRPRARTEVDAEMRGAFQAALGMSPEKFTVYGELRADPIERLSAILRRMLSQAIGREVTASRVPVSGQIGIVR